MAAVSLPSRKLAPKRDPGDLTLLRTPALFSRCSICGSEGSSSRAHSHDSSRTGFETACRMGVAEIINRLHDATTKEVIPDAIYERRSEVAVIGPGQPISQALTAIFIGRDWAGERPEGDWFLILAGHRILDFTTRLQVNH